MNEFADKLLQMSSTDVTFLLTTLSNVARMRSICDSGVVDYITKEIFMISFYNTSTRTSYSKLGRELLQAICLQHPAMILNLLKIIEIHTSDIGISSSYLVQALPLHLVQFSSTHFKLLRSWLVHFKVNDPTNHLARTILNHLDWSHAFEMHDFYPNLSGGLQGHAQLFLPSSAHKFMATSVLEAMNVFLLEKANVGKLPQEAIMSYPLNPSTNNNTGSSKLHTFLPFSQGNHDDLVHFSTWSWCFCLRLKLHPFSELSQKYFFSKRTIEGRPEKNDALSMILNEVVGFVQNPQNEDVVVDGELKSTQLYNHVIEGRSLLSKYLAFSLTSRGYSTSEFLSCGLQNLIDLMESSLFVPSLHCFFICLPMFYCNKKDIVQLLNCNNLVKCMDLILKHDITERTPFDSKPRSSTVNQLTSLILIHMELFSLHLDLCENVVTFWFYVLTKITNWSKNRDVLYIMNNIIKKLYSCDRHLKVPVTFFIDHIKQTQIAGGHPTNHHPGGFLSTITNLFWSHYSEFFSDSSSLQEFRWLRLVVMRAERRSHEEENNLIGYLELRVYGLGHDAMFVEKCYQEACSKAGVDHVAKPLLKLSIYRYASMILETPITCEILPLMWYEFLTMYFTRSLNSCCGLGYNLMSLTPESRTLLKKLKERCHKNVEDLKSPCVMFQHDPKLADKLIQLHNVILLWLDEQRLHDTKLDLNLLPPQYAATLFQSLINKEQHHWFSLMDHVKLDEDVNAIIEMWFQNVIEKNVAQHQVYLNKLSNSLQLKDPYERLMTSFTIHPSTISSPSPPVEKVNCVFSELTPEIYDDEKKLNVFINGDMKLVCELASLHEKRLMMHKQMNDFYADNLKKLYNNVTEETVEVVCCTSYNPSRKCKGGAVLRKRHERRHFNEIASRRLMEVKESTSRLIGESTKMLPLLASSRAVVRVEAIISKLIRQVERTSLKHLDEEGRNVVNRNIEMSLNLFYSMVSYISPLIEHCPPTKEFTHSCIEALGKAFVVNDPNQPHMLIMVIKNSPNLVCLLSQFFHPNSNHGDFVHLYGELQPICDSKMYDVVSSLATKFDIETWSKCSSNNQHSSLMLLKSIINLLSSIGQQPSIEALHLTCVLRSHLQTLCWTNLPFFLLHVLHELISASHKNLIIAEVWDDFSIILGVDYNDKTRFCLDFDNSFNPDHCDLITKHQMFQLMDEMSSIFNSQLIGVQENQTHISTWAGNRVGTVPSYYWLYGRWQAYVPHLSRAFHSTVVVMVTKVRRMLALSTSADFESIMKDMMDMLERIQSLFYTWLNWSRCFQQCYLENSSALISCRSEISCMAASWVKSVEMLHDVFESGEQIHCGVLNHVWSLYVNNLGVEAMPEFLSNIFHVHLITLPWNKFKPQLNCIDNMAKAINFPKPCFEMMGNIFCAVDWKNIFPFLVRNISMSQTMRIHSIMFNIMVRLANEKVVLENTQLPQLLSSTDIFDWSKMLDPHSYSQSLEWFTEACDPNPLITLDLTLTECQIIRLFREASDFYPNMNKTNLPIFSTTDLNSTPRKRCSYVKFMVNIIARSSSSKCPNFDQLDAALSNLLSEIDAIISKENEDTSTYLESRNLCKECLDLLNICPINSANVFLQVFQLWMESSVMSPLITPMVTSACRSLTNAPHLARLIEVFITGYFSLDVTALDACGWHKVLASIEFPEIYQDKFIAECLEKEYFLTLYSFVLFKLSICQSLSDELNIMLKLNDWNTSLKISASNESKIFLWWHKILELGLRQVLNGGSKLAVRSALVQMVPSLVVLGEDKSALGLFGAIGFGKKSGLSLRFRVVACSVASFVASILINDDNLQSSSDQHFDTLSNMLKATDTQTVSQFQQQTVSRLRGMSNDKSYNNYNQHINMSLKFSQDKSLGLLNFREVLSRLVGPLFPEFYLGILHAAVQ